MSSVDSVWALYVEHLYFNHILFLFDSETEGKQCIAHYRFKWIHYYKKYTTEFTPEEAAQQGLFTRYQLRNHQGKYKLVLARLPLNTALTKRYSETDNTGLDLVLKQEQQAGELNWRLNLLN